MCVCVCVCVCACVCVCVCVCRSLCLCMFRHVCIHAYVHTYVPMIHQIAQCYTGSCWNKVKSNWANIANDSRTIDLGALENA